MADPVRVKAATGVSAAGSTSITCTFASAVAAGNLLFFAMAGDKNTGALTMTGTGWTVEVQSLDASVSLYQAWKSAAGGETTVTGSWATASAAGNTAWAAEYSQSPGAAWKMFGKSFTPNGVPTTTARNSGTATLTGSGIALGFAAVDNDSSVGTQVWSDGFVEAHNNNTNDTHAGVYVAEKPITFTPGTSPAVAIADTFTRVDSATTLGSTEIGAAAWVAQGTSVWGISSNKAYTTAAASATVLVESGLNDLDITGKITFNTGGTLPGLVFRALDDTNRLGIFLDTTADQFQLWKMDAGTNTHISAAVGSVVVDPAIEYTVRVVAQGTRILGYLNGTPVMDYTLAGADATKYVGAGYTKVGFRGSTQNRYDDLSVSSIGTAGTTTSTTFSWTAGVADALAVGVTVLGRDTAVGVPNPTAQVATFGLDAQPLTPRVAAAARAAWMSVLGSGDHQLQLGLGPVASDVSGPAGRGFELDTLGPTGQPIFRVERIPGTPIGFGVFVVADLIGSTIPAGSEVRLSWWARSSTLTTNAEAKNNGATQTVFNNTSHAVSDVSWTQVTITRTCLIDWVPGTHRFRASAGSVDTSWLEWSDVELTVLTPSASVAASPTVAPLSFVADPPDKSIRVNAEIATFGVRAHFPIKAGDLVGEAFPCQNFASTVRQKLYSASVLARTFDGDVFPVGWSGAATRVDYDGAASICGR